MTEMRKRIRKALSVYNLFFVSGLRRAAAVILAFLAVQAAVLVYAMQGQTQHFESVATGFCLIPTLIGFIAISIVLGDVLKADKSNVDFTIRRLCVKPITVFGVEALYLMLVLLVYWALSAGLVYAAAVYFTENLSQAANRDMGVLLAFYRSNLLHKLLPVGDIAAWLSNFALIFGLGIATAGASYNARKGKNTGAFRLFMINALVINTLGNRDVMGLVELSLLFLILYIACGILQILWIRSEEEAPENEPTANSKGGRKKNEILEEIE